jgi:hypothetical protein
LRPAEAGTWISVRDERIRRTFAEAVFSHDDIHYLRPEIVLDLKAKLKRPKDDSDFNAAVSLLEADARAWPRLRWEPEPRPYPPRVQPSLGCDSTP